jgi:hemolysin-activating ACP:hemolysin acyltransferase
VVGDGVGDLSQGTAMSLPYRPQQYQYAYCPDRHWYPSAWVGWRVIDRDATGRYLKRFAR